MDTYTLTETHTRPDGTITAVFQVTRATGSYEARIHAADLPAIFARLGIEPDSFGGNIVLPPKENSFSPWTSFDMAGFAAQAG